MATKQFQTKITSAAKGDRLGGLIPSGNISKIKQAAAVKKQQEEIGKVGRPRRKDKDNTQAAAAERGTKPGEMRKTYLVNIELAEKLEAVAYWDRRSVKEVIYEAMHNYLATYEKRNGAIKPIKK
jgi:hypothetical protein